jgi:putative aminopeptidase FrvX
MSARTMLSLVAAVLLGSAAPALAQNPASEGNLLRELLFVPGLSGQEGAVVDFIQARLPKSLGAQRDAMGNLWFTVGSGGPHLLFVAHTDELGFTVGSISSDGLVKLKGRGGFLPQTLEGAPFLVYAAGGPVEGVIRPRPDYDTAKPLPFAPEAYELDLGLESAEEARSLGIAEGNAVIPKKRLVELGSGALACRAVDDRAGCAALLAAVLQTDWSRVKGRTITCAWSVEEEIGLLGAAALSRVLKPDAVLAIDTFVSSDSPLENKRIADAVLGKGAVLRALDNSSLTPRPALDRMLALAARRKLPVQTAGSRGGNDGSVFVPGGAVDIPLAWPGTYAHSFIEKIYRSDLASLVELIKIAMVDY